MSNTLSLSSQLRALVPAVAAWQAERDETATARRERGTGRPRDAELGKQLRDNIVKYIEQAGHARVKDIAAEFGIGAGRMSHHLTVLLHERRIKHRGNSHDGYEIRRTK